MEDIKLDFTKVSNIEFADIDYLDCPDYADAHIVSADYDGQNATSEQIDEMNEDRDFCYEKLMDYLH